jgi:hypothetical protein
VKFGRVNWAKSAELAEAGGGIGAGGEGLDAGSSGAIGDKLGGTGLRDPDADVPVQMVLGTGGTISLAGVFIALAGEFIATADAVAVTGLGSSLDGYQGHGSALQQKITRDNRFAEVRIARWRNARCDP